jgi:hypothetical protein
MAHYALLDENNIVTKVIVGRDEVTNDPDAPPEMINYWEEYYANLTGMTCKRTSYNSHAGQHSMPDCECFRKNYAGIGYTYDVTRDAFIPPKPYNSWVLDENSCCWQAPIAQPSEGGPYVWNEEILNWEVVNLP